MDITASTAPRSDQQNFDDYIAGDRVVTVTEVKAGSAEQPIEIHLEEFPGRPYKPSKSMRRVLVQAWGPEATAYVGRKMRLYGDPEVTFGRDKVGGIKIRALSHIDKRLELMLTATRGKRKPHVVEPLVDAPTSTGPTSAQVKASTDADQLRAWWKTADPELRILIESRVSTLALPASSADVDPNPELTL